MMVVAVLLPAVATETITDFAAETIAAVLLPLPPNGYSWVRVQWIAALLTWQSVPRRLYWSSSSSSAAVVLLPALLLAYVTAEFAIAELLSTPVTLDATIFAALHWMPLEAIKKKVPAGLLGAVVVVAVVVVAIVLAVRSRVERMLDCLSMVVAKEQQCQPA